MIDDNGARELAERYFGALQRFDLDALVACFTPDATYSHPVYDPAETGRDEARGRAGIAEMLRTKRGPRSIVQKISSCVTRGEVCYLEGTAEDTDGNVLASWVSSARLSPDGLFSSYAAYQSLPPVGTALTASLSADAALATDS